jgi:hypothetical protein
MKNIWKLFKSRTSDGLRRYSRGLYTIYPKSNSEDRLFLKVKIRHPREISEHPLFVLSRGNWHCQYMSSAKPCMHAWRNNDYSAWPESVMITTGLSGNLEPFRLRIFYMKSYFTNWWWRPTNAIDVCITNPSDSDFLKPHLIIDLKGSKKWYEADSFDKGLLLKGEGKFGPHETEENRMRRFHE